MALLEGTAEENQSKFSRTTQLLATRTQTATQKPDDRWFLKPQV
jgi:hypothetical protein